jgi:hypothetical protein
MRLFFQSRGNYQVCATSSRAHEPVVRLRRSGFQTDAAGPSCAHKGGAGRNGWILRLVRAAWSN